MESNGRKCPAWVEQFCHWVKKDALWIAGAMILYILYKVPINNLTGGFFNAPFLIVVCGLFVLYFTKEYEGERNEYVLISFALYAVYIIIQAITGDNFTFVKRGVYEYGFYQVILFATAFLVSKVSKEKLVKAVTILGFPFVVAGVVGALTYTPGPAYSGDTAMRVVGWARSPLSLGMLSGIYTMFAFTQARMSRNKWYWITVAVGVFSLLVSGSRGPLLATLTAVAVYLLVEVVAAKGKKAIKPIGITAGVLVVVAILFFTSDLEFSNSTINDMYLRMKRIVDWNGDAGNVGRLETWNRWFEVFLDHFWFGIGMSRTGSWGPGTLGVTESGLLRHLVELGFVGSVLYYNLIISCIVTTVKAVRKNKNKLDHFMLLNIAIIVLVLVEDMVLQITEEITVAFFLWWCLGALLGVAERKKDNRLLCSEKEFTDNYMIGASTKISVVMTTYNGAKFVIEQLESLRLQTRQPDEVLIFDDCSSDDTPSIVQDFIQRYHLEHWTFTVNQRNKGWKENFKDGLLQAKGDLVFPCDQDDIWRKDKLEICEKIMSGRPDILVLTSNYEQFGDCKQKVVPNRNDKKIVPVDFNGNLFHIFYPGCSYCIRGSFLKDIEKNWTPNSPHDATIWRYAIIRNGLFALNDDLLLWRVYKTSTYELELSKNHNREKKRQWLDYAMGVVSDVENYVTDHEEYQTEQVLRALKTNKKFLSMRMDLYDHVNVLTGLRLLGYLKYYAAPIQYMGDWLHVVHK